ncbi:MAG: hypothetical protein ACOCUS_03905 [Polyangiales bacterium]
MTHDPHEAKGVWFSTARHYVQDEHGSDALESVIQRMPPEHREAMRDPIASHWYPEETLQECLAALRVELAGGEARSFEPILEGLARQGLSRFLSALLQLSSPRFVLRQVPTAWRLIRRGPAEVRVDRIDGGTEVLYVGFPYFSDYNYRLLTVASLRTLVEQSAGSRPEIAIVERDDDSLRIRVRHD